MHSLEFRPSYVSNLSPFLYLVVLKFNDKTWVKRKWGQVIKINKTHQFTGDKEKPHLWGLWKRQWGR